MLLVKIISPKLNPSRLRTIKVIAQSEKSWEEAAQMAFQELRETFRNLQSLRAEGFEAGADQVKSTIFRVTAKASFIVEND